MDQTALIGVRVRLRFIVVFAVLTGSITTGKAQTGLYIQTDMGLSVAPPLAAGGSDNDRRTKCDLTIYPLGVEVTNECDETPPRTSWTNAFGGAADIQSGFALGFHTDLFGSMPNRFTGWAVVPIIRTLQSSMT